MRRGRTTIAAAIAGVIAAGATSLALFGFTVDDALIPARYATHIARGLGYRFNAAGAVTDGVTPLGYPYLLAPFAENAAHALAAAKLLGLLAWWLGAASLGVAIERSSERRARFFAFAIVAASAPLGAWSGAGLETGLTVGFTALAVSLAAFDRPRLAAVAAGLAAWLRPELVVWSLLTALAPRADGDETKRARLARALLAATPFALVVGIRLFVFHRPAPLAVLAKPADLAHGLVYAGACLVLTGPIALLAPRAWLRLTARERWMIAAVFVHFAVVALVGGDWMPLSRLVVPVLPAVALGVAALARVAEFPWFAGRFALALAGELFALVKIGPSAARIGRERARLAEELAPALAESRVVATLDVGWVGAVTEATIVDLAGLTDPVIASLPGGHTSKEISRTLLESRHVDTIVLLLMEGKTLAAPWSESWFARAVEDRVAEIPDVGQDFEVVAKSEREHLGYVVVKRRAPPAR